MNHSQQKQKSFANNKQVDGNDAINPAVHQQEQQSNQKPKRSFEDLSSIHPSPRIGAGMGQQLTTNPYLNLDEFQQSSAGHNNINIQSSQKQRGNLKDILENQIGQKSSKQNDDNLNLNKNEYSMASSLPDLIDASQILRRQSSNYKLNQLDSSQAAIGPYLQDSQHKFREPETHPNNSLLPMSPRSSNNNPSQYSINNQSSFKKYQAMDQSTIFPLPGGRAPPSHHYRRQMNHQDNGNNQYSN